MLAGATTLWAMFALWLVGDSLGMPRGLARTAGGLLVLELVALLTWSYGCDIQPCTPLGEIAGVAARTDVPILAAVYVLVVVAAYWRRERRSVADVP